MNPAETKVLRYRLDHGLRHGSTVALVAVVTEAPGHAIVRPGDLSRVGAAFFTANGFVSVALAAFGIADVLVS